jgi:hypothetical protein
MKYDLPLSNTLYLKNLKSYLKLADEDKLAFYAMPGRTQWHNFY